MSIFKSNKDKNAFREDIKGSYAKTFHLEPSVLVTFQ